MHLTVDGLQHLKTQPFTEWLQWWQHEEKLWGQLFSGCTDAVMRNINIHSAWYSKDSGCVLSGSGANIMLLSQYRNTVQDDGTTLLFMCFVNYCVLKTKPSFSICSRQCVPDIFYSLLGSHPFSFSHFLHSDLQFPWLSDSGSGSGSGRDSSDPGEMWR